MYVNFTGSEGELHFITKCISNLKCTIQWNKMHDRGVWKVFWTIKRKLKNDNISHNQSVKFRGNMMLFISSLEKINACSLLKEKACVLVHTIL